MSTERTLEHIDATLEDMPPGRVFRTQVRDNGNAAPRCVNTKEPLTHFTRYGEEGLAMKATRVCKIDKCERPIKARGWCAPHYSRWLRYGDPSDGVRFQDEPLINRFMAKVDKSGSCWEWLASSSKQGYGMFRVKRVTRWAHRVSYEMHVGAIPDGFQIDHLCRNPSCVNPDHLEAVPQRVNNSRSESVSARAMRRDVCAHGHPYDEENTLIYDGHRYCRACRRIRNAELVTCDSCGSQVQRSSIYRHRREVHGESR